MAISVITQPLSIHPIYHPVSFYVDSTLKNELNFKYVFKILSSASVLLRKIKVSPEIITGRGFVDIKNHLLDFLNQDIFDIQATLDFQKAPQVEYFVRMDEEYTDSLGTNIVNTDVFSFSQRTAYNSIFTRNEFLGDLTKYQVDNFSNDRKMLININPLSEVEKDDIFFVHFTGLVASGFRPMKFKVLELDSSGTQISSHIISGGLNTTQAQIARVDLGLISFNRLTEFVDLSVTDVDTLNATEAIRLKLIDSCSFRDNYKLIYLDSKGSYCSLNFRGVLKRTLRNRAKRFEPFINPLNDTLSNAPKNRSVKKYYQDLTETIKLNTLLTSEKNNIMFEDLLISDRVFLDTRSLSEFSNIDFMPIEVLSNSLKPITFENDFEIPQYSFEIRHSFEQINR